MRMPAKGRKARGTGYLDGQLLIAMPSMPDPRFARSVIYMCAHSAEGAMGLIINQRAQHISFSELLRQLDIVKLAKAAVVPAHIQAMAVHVGGPVEKGRGFVLHSADYKVDNSTMAIEGGICLTATVEILKAIATGAGPDRAILALGYSGWAPGQLESEMQSNGWLHCPADADIIFAGAVEEKYARALSKLGIDPSHLVSDAGHA